MAWENPIDLEIRQELAGLLHEAGLKPEECIADGPMAVIIPSKRVVILDLEKAHREDFRYVMVLTNDALSAHVTGDNWLKVLDELKRLQEAPSEAPVV